MKSTTAAILIAAVGSSSASALPAVERREFIDLDVNPIASVQVGVRPYWLVDDMDTSETKKALQSCIKDTSSFEASEWSIGHRGGGTLQIPEHSLESNLAGARMGAGILECDVAFTKDLELVCRHSHCDLHSTTNIVTIPELNEKCQVPFVPSDGTKPAQAKCCTQDITLKEFEKLCATMEGVNEHATTAEEYIKGTPDWRTDLYTCGTMLSLKEHIKLVEDLELKHIPELKTPELPMPEGFTQEDFAAKMLKEYLDAKVEPSDVFPQSFLYSDIMYWKSKFPAFAKNLVFLDDTDGISEEKAIERLEKYAADNIPIVAPALNMLITNENKVIVPSEYAKAAKKLGMDIIAWTIERSGRLGEDKDEYYYQTVHEIARNDGKVFEVLRVLLKDIQVKGVFSDWAATTTFFENCMW
ncbi:Extracellular protein [Ceratocystis fimbriata CBS 114723]|uniref:glycerophosphodiester phosphodiesterase n=1 Tax=Ceratocystis fimbriata CBS 114723 TaxID=1035309 RepID=A0A2C5XC40_9PEZI|nr:Extracellular protein [Ceratocystis fimbriata CBS 114723]